MTLGTEFGVKGRLDRARRVDLNVRLGAKTVHDQGPQMAGVTGRIRDDMADALEPLDQGRSLRTGAALASRRDQPHGEPKGIDGGVDLGGQAAARTPDPVSLSPPPSARRIRVGFPYRAVDEEVVEVGVRAQVIEKALPYPRDRPPSEPRMRAGPLAELRWQIAQGGGRPRQPQHRIHE